jgi:preprotein translocase subunit SecF
MPAFRLIPDQPRLHFVRYQYWAYVFSGALIVLTLILLPTRGLNLGIDFRGGVLIEVGMPSAPDLALMRASLDGLGLGEIALQEFGDPSDILIRLERQPGGEPAQLAAAEQVKATLQQQFGADISYRRIEMVGPKVSADLLRAGSEALVFALLAILVYVWFRFEWQFGVGAVVALIHDAVATLGLYSLFGLEFNLSSVAALLTIVGYSINDTVVIYDRIRENLLRYKAMPLADLVDRSLNETLARTTMTSFTTLLALIALAFFGGPVVRGFTIAMIWGVFVGTFSSIYVASPIVLHLRPRREPDSESVSALDIPDSGR